MDWTEVVLFLLTSQIIFTIELTITRTHTQCSFILFWADLSGNILNSEQVLNLFLVSRMWGFGPFGSS